ncbi:hypothetical protein [Streptomyces fulvorobeus]|uniref:Uncharacterized protein n=1 Tax=Streptomyces fulvorobeus TaxID=284028 RepID=A0A7J0CFA2_9ACTN|nr:hypothetical protein [Streptomyces fulvorobeus]NYE44635.1 hypothetical protein [Streptomyces fulvorobeus]GFN01183.1 hypothetical protein Sfulv_59930 [Streptomyces fulvorobeus]
MLLLSLTGATVTLFMAGRQRDREVALLMVSGGTTATVVAAAASGAVIYVTTAVLLAVPTVPATGLIGAWALDMPPAFGLGAVGIVVGAGLVLITAAAVVPAMLALRQNTVRALASERDLGNRLQARRCPNPQRASDLSVRASRRPRIRTRAMDPRNELRLRDALGQCVQSPAEYMAFTLTAKRTAGEAAAASFAPSSVG